MAGLNLFGPQARVPAPKKTNVPPGCVRLHTPILLGVLSKTNSNSLFPEFVGKVHGTRLVHAGVSSKAHLARSAVWPLAGSTGVNAYIKVDKAASLNEMKLAVAQAAFPGQDRRWAKFLCCNKAVLHASKQQVLTLLLTDNPDGIYSKKLGTMLPRLGLTS